MTDPQELKILADFAEILDKLQISYAIGGSIASSIYGQVRFTQDADITVEPFDDHAEKFYQDIKSDFYISKTAMYQALKDKTGFNLIHLSSAFKIDIFIRKDTNYQKQLLSRRKLIKLQDSHQNPVSVVSPEDIILLKLQWYKQADCSSERQWNDVLGVIKIRKKEIDIEYLRKWSCILGINELLQNALKQTDDSNSN